MIRVGSAGPQRYQRGRLTDPTAIPALAGPTVRAAALLGR
jgi:hypothetical protein